MRGYAREDCVAVGDSREDLAHGLRDRRLLARRQRARGRPHAAEELAGVDGLRVAEAGHGAGVYEAVVTTLAERGGEARAGGGGRGAAAALAARAGPAAGSGRRRAARGAGRTRGAPRPARPAWPSSWPGSRSRGRAIALVRVGDLAARRRVLVVGCRPRRRGGGPRIADELLAARARRRGAAGVELLLVRDANPDGHARRTRQNARGVDLNRNSSQGWRPMGGPTRRPAAARGPSPRRAGPARPHPPRAPRLVVWYHQPLGLVDAPESGRATVARRYAAPAGLPFRPLPHYPGSLSRWVNARVRAGSSFVVELPPGAGRARPARPRLAAVGERPARCSTAGWPRRAVTRVAPGRGRRSRGSAVSRGDAGRARGLGVEREGRRRPCRAATRPPRRGVAGGGRARGPRSGPPPLPGGRALRTRSLRRGPASSRRRVRADHGPAPGLPDPRGIRAPRRHPRCGGRRPRVRPVRGRAGGGTAAVAQGAAAGGLARRARRARRGRVEQPGVRRAPTARAC